MIQIRKTNLFNITDDNIPQFITLSNYPDSMTGTHLAVNSKLWPGSFIALYLPSLDMTDNTVYTDFIKHIASHYENKMAFLRDYVSDNGDSITKSDLCPLDYLIDSIYKFDSNASIKYIGDIVEQNYDSVWSDMFLSVDTSLCDCNYIINESKSEEKLIPYIYQDDKDTRKQYLYGWYENGMYTGPESYNGIKPVFDSKNDDNKDCYYAGLKYSNIAKEKTDTDNIKFNIIIPLYNMYIEDPSVDNAGSASVTNIDNNSDTDDSGQEGKPVIDFSNLYNSSNNITLKNYKLTDAFVPYGIWYSGSKPISLNKNTDSQTAAFAQPVWTLTLSSQFKAFPYTLRTDPADRQINNTELANKEKTFAEILSAQNHIMDRFEGYEKQLSVLQNEIRNLKAVINNK